MKDVGEPCAGEPHARFDGRGLETERYCVTAPVPDPTATYPGIQPDTEGVKVTPEERSEGRVSQARTLLNEQHWTGTGWALDRVEIERITQFDSAAHAAAYLATWRQAHAGSTLTTFGTVTVAIAGTQTDVVAEFVVGADAINLDAADAPTAQPQDQDAIIAAAVAAASTAK